MSGCGIRKGVLATMLDRDVSSSHDPAGTFLGLHNEANCLGRQLRWWFVRHREYGIVDAIDEAGEVGPVSQTCRNSGESISAIVTTTVRNS